MSELLDTAAVLERAKQITTEDTDRCEDCPEFNSNPPRYSDCPYFDTPEGKPICTKEDNTQKQQRFAHMWFGSDTADRACSQ